MGIASKYKAAIAFLCVILLLSIILVFIYFALKRGLCNCFAGGKSDDTEHLYDDNERDDENDYDPVRTELGEEQGEDSRSPPADDIEIQIPPHTTAQEILENYNEMRGVPEVVITESDFVEPHKKKTSHMNSILKKIRRPGRVRFQDSPTEGTALMDTQVNIYGNHNNHNHKSGPYGIELSPLRRSDSMESFMSGLSSVTTNAEEFGDELSPSRIQIFIQYTPKQWMLTIGVKQAECILLTEKQNNMYWQVHMTLLPFKKDRFKTRYKSTSTPVFNDSFEVDNIAKQALTQMSVRYRLYGRAGRTGRKKLAGEVEIELGCLTHKQDNLIKEWRILKRKNLTYRGNHLSNQI